MSGRAPRRRRWLRYGCVGGLGIALALAGCRSTAPRPTAASLAAGLRWLSRPLPGDMAALYRLRVPSSGGLRLAVLTRGDAGRLTVSEPLGSAVSITSWSDGGVPEVLDMRRGCRLPAGWRPRFLGSGRLPLPELVRLLGGRLPAVAGDRVAPGSGGGVAVRGEDFSCTVEVRPDPWRVVAVSGPAGERPAWRIELSGHTSSLPGRIRAWWGDDGRVELVLVRLEWNTVRELPRLPAMPPCDVR